MTRPFKLQSTREFGPKITKLASRHSEHRPVIEMRRHFQKAVSGQCPDWSSRLRDVRLRRQSLFPHHQIKSPQMKESFCLIRVSTELVRAPFREVLFGIKSSAGIPGNELILTPKRGGPRPFGGMLSFQVRGSREAALDVAAGCKLFIRATSLGGARSLIEHRASIEGPTTRTPQNLLRLLIGLEHTDDLIADLEQALSTVPA
jgi:Cys/Met metabolism PLP-dependent enzyme